MKPSKPSDETAPAKTLSTPPPENPRVAPTTDVPERDPARYELVREAGRGGIGRVLEARDCELGRRVAIKELLQHSGESEARFFREARLTARLEHPSVVPVHDAGRWPGSKRPFYSMKLVSGRSLQALAQDAKTLAARLALLPNVLAVAEAVAYAHSERIVHRDLKPANVVVGEYGETIVIDWGLAKDLREQEVDSTDPAVAIPAGGGLTQVGSVMGTPWFMPPEQARGELVDERADVYALGAILYFVLSGALPYPGEDGIAVIRALLAAPPAPLKQREPHVPADLAAIVEKAMARSRDDRYRDAGALAADLKRFQTGQLVGAHQYSSMQLATRWIRRNRGIAAFLALLVAGSAAYVARVSHLRNVAESARAESESQTRKLLEQSGRVELDLGKPSRAAVYLAEAIRRNPDKVALRMLVKEAASALDTRLFPLEGHTRDVVCAAWNAAGTRIITGSADRTVRIWDAGSGKEIRTLKKHERWLEDVTFSPDGRFAGSVGAGDFTVLWNVATGEIVHAFPVGGFRVAFSPDSKTFLMGGKRGELFVWDVESGKALLEAKPFRDRTAAFAFHPSEPILVIGSWDGTVSWWDTRTWKQTRTVDEDPEGISSLDVSDDGEWLLSGGFSGRMNMRRATSPDILHGFEVPPGARSMTAWLSPDARTIVTASHDGVFRVWHAGSGVLLRAVDAVPSGKMFDGALSPDGDRLVTTHLRGADVWSVGKESTYRLADVSQHRGTEIQPGAMSPDGTFLAGVQGRDSTTEIVVWDARTGAQLRAWKDEGQAHSLAIGGKGTRVLTAGTDRLPPRLWDANGKRIAILDGHGKSIVHDVAASDDGALLATAGYDGRVLFWTSDAGERTGPEIVLPMIEGTPRKAIATAIAFSPDASRIAITDENGVLYIAKTSDGAVVSRTAAHLTWIQDVAFSHDGTRIVTTGRQDHMVKIWDAATLAQLHTLSGHQHNGMRASFSPDDTLVASVSIDQTARLWDARTGDLLRTLPGPNNAAVFDAKGTSLFTVGIGDYAVLWDLTADTRTPDAIAASVAEGSSWQLCDGGLVPDAQPCQ